MDVLKELLAKECNYRFSMDSPVMEKFLSSLTEVHLKSGGVLIYYGQLDSNLYIIRSGILKLSYLDGDKEVIFAFGMNGSLLTQMHGYYLRKPSFFQCEACTDTVVMKISKQQFDAFVEESHEFARWALDRAVDQLCGLEMRLDRINGSAKDRYLSLMQIMPEVAANVRSKDIASYLGITPIYFSKLKKELSSVAKARKEEISLMERNSFILANKKG